MLEELFLEINNRYDSNIYISTCGHENCQSGHSFGPAVRDYYLIHFIIRGKGTYYSAGKTYKLKKNDLFLISPGDLTYYKSDKDNPWYYSWVGFNGIKASTYLDLIGLNRDNPCMSTKHPDFIKPCLHSIYESSKISRGGEVRMLGNLYLFLSKLIEETKSTQNPSKKDDYIQKAIEYVEMNYTRRISIQNISDYLGLNRSYFSDLFKKRLGIPPQKFIIKYRINRAKEMIKQHPELSFSHIAKSIGYNDQLAFSKVFRKETSQTPSKLRNQIMEQTK